jgi:hypothetical protein
MHTECGKGHACVVGGRLGYGMLRDFAFGVRLEE